jgi:3-methyladenine DNA glycosylase Mpg
MRAFKNARQVFVQSHYTWAEAIHKNMQDINNGLKDYKYVKDAIDLCKALELDINENELQRTAGVSLTIYQPENLASLIKSRRAKQDNKSVIAQFKKARQSQVATVN